MRTIQILEQKTIDQIAAGEVVERPASVVKELIENAIDASADAITVEIRDGGASLIRITDNGGGIPADQVRLAFTRHATSKIRTLDDLVQIRSLGFRGEALSSIAAVARVELITRTSDALTGIRYCIDGGTEKEYEEIGAPLGTTFLIRNLFYNTPVRAKFLKSAQTEGNHVTAVVEQMALSHPDISFKLVVNGQNRLFTGGTGDLKEIVYQIYGRDMAKLLIPVEGATEEMKITGFIGNPEVARGNRNFENYFVNGRYIKSRLIARAIEDGYHGFMMQHRYPFTLLYLEIDPRLVDVNVHPTKMEVRIQEQELVAQQLTLTIQNALIARERIPEISLQKRRDADKKSGEADKKNVSAPEPFERARRAAEILLGKTGAVRESQQAYPGVEGNSSGAHESRRQDDMRAGAHESRRHGDMHAGTHESRKRADMPDSDQPSRQHVETPDGMSSGTEQMELFPEKMLAQSARPMHRLIGQLFGTYWMIEFRDSLYIVDQHAAHEKVLYERLMKAHREKTIHAQMITPARVLTLTAAETTRLEEHLDSFRALGFELEPFGGNDYRITAVPANLYGVPVDQLFTDILDALEGPEGQTPGLVLEKLASMSCRAAVKGSHTMSPQEADALIDELLGLENPYNCPHGRPTIVSMSHYELDRKFRRIV